MKVLFFALFHFYFFSLLMPNCFETLNRSIKAESGFVEILDKPDYSQIFKYEYPVALKLLKDNLQLFKKTFSTYKIDTALAVSIVFPEFIRYSNYKDIIETHSLEVIYVNLGKEYIDFSIGLMQMKPSFAEKLEICIKTSANLTKKYKFICTYESENAKEIRALRIERLKSVQWQLYYLCAFCDVVSKRYKSSLFSSKYERIKFYAAAYNCDFLASEEKINKQAKLKYFPHGKNWAMPQYSYSEIAAHFYNNYYVDFQ